MIIRESLKQSKSINLTGPSLSQDLEAIVEPFACHDGLLSLAKGEVSEVCTFVIFASSVMVTWHAGVPSIVSTTTSGGQTLTSCPDIRKLEVFVHNTLEGADWNSSDPVTLPANTTDLIAVLPRIFPRLDSITIKVLNLGLVESGAKYTKFHVTQPAQSCPNAMATEKACRMYLLLCLAHQTIFQAWKQSQRRVEKRVIFAQSMRAAREEEGLCKRVRSVGLLQAVGPVGPSGKNKKRMWELCDWQKVRVTFL